MPSLTAARVGRERALGAVALLAEHDVGGRADVDHGEPAGELGEALARDPRGRSRAGRARPRLRIWPSRASTASAVPAPSTNVHECSVTITRRALPRYSRRTFSSVRPASSVMTSPPGEGGQVLEVRDAAVPEARAPARRPPSRGPVRRVVHEHPERRAVDLLGEDHERPRLLHDLVEQRHQVRDRRDRLGRHEDVRVLVDRLHARLSVAM
jgi:hypothetical protein